MDAVTREPYSRLDWYVIHTKPRQEDRAEASLRMLGLETLNPKLRRTVRSAMSTPLFPRYIFAQFRLEQMFRQVRWSRGVHRIVEFGGIPAIVDYATVQFIRSYLEEGNIVNMMPTFHRGDRVRIVEGPFRDFIGIFEKEMPDAERVMLLLSHVQFFAHLIVDKVQVQTIVTDSGAFNPKYD
jgi:transcriptional antiterminator RfaH